MVNLNLLASIGVTLILVYFGYKFGFGGSDGRNNAFGESGDSNEADSRDILAQMANNNKQVVVFYGSQTGTAEDLASKLAKEISSKFGLKTMTADPENYEFSNLDAFPQNYLAIFLVASYGDGEPTDNAQDFFNFITNSPSFSEGGEKITNLQCAVFGLGNSSYEYYNKMGRTLHKVLTDLGANLVAPYGEGDDGKGSMEEDFMAWKEKLFDALANNWGVEAREAVYEPSIDVKELENLSASSSDVYLGEPNLKHLMASKDGSTIAGPFTTSNPLLAKVSKAYELFKDPERHCIHMEFETSELKYNSGDHLAVWAQNSEEEITRFLTALGLTSKRNTVIGISVLDKTSPVRVPSPTTYDTVVRYYLEINGPVSRQSLSDIAPYAPTEASKSAILKLANDKNLFHSEVTEKCFNLARLLLYLSNNEPWTAIPFNFIIETVPHLQPRYYSISSSSLETPDKISITAVVERHKPSESSYEVRGVVTNNIMAIERALNDSDDGTYNLQRPARPGVSRSDRDFRLPVHVRHSTFKLPKPNVPIIMIGPGTGVAPFRGFVHERATLASQGTEIAKAMLFFGARRKDTEFLYSEEWIKYSDWLDLELAFSRDGPKKVYVQDRLRARSAEVNKLIEDGAVIYVCGDASRMAHDVYETLGSILVKERKISEEEAEKQLRKLRSRNKYQEDVW